MRLAHPEKEPLREPATHSRARLVPGADVTECGVPVNSLKRVQSTWPGMVDQCRVCLEATREVLRTACLRRLPPEPFDVEAVAWCLTARV